MWHNLIDLPIPVLEKIVRPIVVYVFLIIAFRLMGKRELAQLNPFDFTVLLTISNTVQNAIIGHDESLLGGLIGATTLFAVNYLTIRLLFKNRKLDRLVEGRRTYLIRDGMILTENLQKELITRVEFANAAYKQDIATLDDVETAILDRDGKIVFIRKYSSEDRANHQELLQRLQHITDELAVLRAAVPLTAPKP